MPTRFVEFEPFYTPDGYRATTLSRDEWSGDSPTARIWMAGHNSRIAGTVSAIVRPDGVYVRSMAVGPAARGCGIARLLFSIRCGSSPPRRTSHHLYLSTTPFLASAIQLYERAGFVRTSAPPYEFFGTPLFTMEKWSNGVDVR